MNTKGYNPVSVREIAKAVGLSEMTVFRHFPSKYAMLMAAMRRAPYAEMIEDVFTTHVRWELEHDLRHFMRRYMDIAEQRIGIWRIISAPSGRSTSTARSWSATSPRSVSACGRISRR